MKERDQLEAVIARDASEFSEDEAESRLIQLFSAAKESSDAEVKKKCLATMAVLRQRVRRLPSRVEGVTEIASGLGAPAFRTAPETLDWIAEHLRQDGWEPLPLFRFVRQ